MKKRVAAIVLSLAVVLGIISVPGSISAAENESIREYEILKATGIFRFDETFNTQEGISVGNFLVLLVNALGGSYNEYSDAVFTTATQDGLLDGKYQDFGRFIEYSDAVELAKRALSYGNYMDSEAADSLLKLSALTKGISNTTSRFISCDNAVKLIYNMVTMGGIYELRGLNSDGRNLEYDKEGSLLSKFRDIYIVEGVVTENRYTTMYEEGVLLGNDLKIEGEQFHSNQDYSEFFGVDVTAFVYIPDREDDANIIYLEERGNKNKFLSVTAEDLIAWDSSKTRLTYYENTRKKTLTVDKSAVFLYNDVICTDFSNETLLPKDGEINLIDNDADGKYDVVKITANEYFPVEYISTSANIIQSKYSYDGCLQKLKLNMDDQGTYVEITKDGQPITLKDIKEWDILTVKKSMGENPKLTRIEVSDKKITTWADEVNLNDRKVTLEGQEYTLSCAVLQAMNDADSQAREPSANYELTYYFAADGKIAGVYGELTDNMQTGYLVKVAKDIEGLETRIRLRLFEDTGEWQTLDLAEKVVFNENRVNAEDVYAQLHPGQNPDRQVIRFVTNSEGEVKKLMTAVETTQTGYDGFSRSGLMSGRWRIKGKCFDSKVFLPAVPKIFVVPQDEDSAKESDYRMGSTSDFATDELVTFEAYNLDEFSVAEIIVLSVEPKANTFAVVSSVGTAMNGNSEPQRVIYGKIGEYDNFKIFISDYCTTFTDYYSKEGVYSVDTLQPGDMLLLAMNTSGEVVQIQRLYTLSDGQKPRQTNEIYVPIVDFSNWETSNNFNEVYKYTAATVEKTSEENSLILMNYIYDFGSRLQAIKTEGSTTYTVVDANRRNVNIRTGSFSDIDPGDYVFIEVAANSAKTVFIIKNNGEVTSE